MIIQEPWCACIRVNVLPSYPEVGWENDIFLCAHSGGWEPLTVAESFNAIMTLWIRYLVFNSQCKGSNPRYGVL